MPKNATPIVEKKPRKKRMPLSDEAKAIMTAKRRATIAAKKAPTVMEKVVESLLDDRDSELEDQEAEPAVAVAVAVAVEDYTPILYSEPVEKERCRIFGLLIDIEEFGYSGTLTLDKWLTTQAGLTKEQAISYAEEYINNRQRLKKQYEYKPIDITNMSQVSERLSEFYKVCPYYTAY